MSPARIGAFGLGLCLGLFTGACFSPPSGAVLFSCDVETAPQCPAGYVCRPDGCCHDEDDADWEQTAGDCSLAGVGGTSVPLTTGSPDTTSSSGSETSGSDGATSSGSGDTAETTGATDTGTTDTGTTDTGTTDTGTTDSGTSDGATTDSTGAASTGGSSGSTGT